MSVDAESSPWLIVALESPASGPTSQRVNVLTNEEASIAADVTLHDFYYLKRQQYQGHPESGIATPSKEHELDQNEIICNRSVCKLLS